MISRVLVLLVCAIVAATNAETLEIKYYHSTGCSDPSNPAAELVVQIGTTCDEYYKTARQYCDSGDVQTCCDIASPFIFQLYTQLGEMFLSGDVKCSMSDFSVNSKCQKGLEDGTYYDKFKDRCDNGENKCSNACETFIADLTNDDIDDWVDEMQDCSQYFELYKFTSKTNLAGTLYRTADDCGFDAPTNIDLDGCLAGMAALGYDDSCPKQCEEDADEVDEDNDLPLCNTSQPERTPSTCNTATCKAFLQHSLENADKTLENLNSCTGPFAQFANILPSTDYLLIGALSTASQCGITLDDSDVDLTPCVKGYTTLAGFDQACPQTCTRDENDDENKRRCKDGEAEYDKETCGTSRCKSYLVSAAEDIDDWVPGLQNCTGDLSAVAAYGMELLESHVLNLGDVCGHSADLDMSAFSKCSKAIHKLSQFDIKCPKMCNSDDEDDNGLPTCVDDQPERSQSTCGNDECKNFLEAFSYYEMASDIQSCKGAQADPYKAYFAEPDNLGLHLLKAVASQCGFPGIDFEKTTTITTLTGHEKTTTSAVTTSTITTLTGHDVTGQTHNSSGDNSESTTLPSGSTTTISNMATTTKVATTNMATTTKVATTTNVTTTAAAATTTTIDPNADGSESKQSKDDKGMNTAQIALIAVVAILAVAFVVLAVMYVKMKRSGSYVSNSQGPFINPAYE